MMGEVYEAVVGPPVMKDQAIVVLWKKKNRRLRKDGQNLKLAVL